MSDKSRYLDFLPAHFQENDFLGRFLLPFEDHLAELGAIVGGIARYFDPYLTDPDFLPWLGSWVALVLDPEWDEAKRRELIAKAVDLYRHRGTVKGLKEYLKIYTGLEPEIREWCWPSGMQIGVASMIGGLTCYPPLPPGFPADPLISDLSPLIQVRRYEPVYQDYYVVDRLDGTEPSQVYYAVNSPKAVHVEFGYENQGLPSEAPYVVITAQDGTTVKYAPATVTRRDGLINDVYPLVSGQEITADYEGDTFLIDELSGEDILPYRFIVDVKIPPDQRDKVRMDKVKAIVDLEKPAHTLYYLKLTYVESRVVFEPMQIEVRSDIGINTVTG
jgi:phage tail-like protein